jgi:hypothetical protein
MKETEKTTRCSQFTSNLIIFPHPVIVDDFGRTYRIRKVLLPASPHFRTVLTIWDDCSDSEDAILLNLHYKQIFDALG